jgi:hypothetical protein
MKFSLFFPLTALALAGCGSTIPVQGTGGAISSGASGTGITLGGGGAGGEGAGGSGGAGGSTSMSSTGTSGPGVQPICVAPSSTFLKAGSPSPLAWSRQIGDGGDVVSSAFAADSKGNLLLVGIAHGLSDFGAGPVPGVGNVDLFVAKYDPAGSLLWVRRFGATSIEPSDVAVDSQDRLVITGMYTSGPIALATAGIADLPFPKVHDRFVLALAASGEPRWAHAIGGPGADSPGRVTVAPGDDVIVAGTDAKHALVLDRFTASGDPVFEQRAIGALHDVSAAFGVPIDVIRADSHGDIFITGTAGVDAAFAPGYTLASGDIYLAKYSGTDGSRLWARRFHGQSNNEADRQQTLLLVDDDVVIAGATYGEIDLGAGPLSATCGSGNGAFLARLSGADGAYRWSRGIRTDQSLLPQLFRDSKGRVVLTIFLAGPSDLGGGSFPVDGPDSPQRMYTATYDPANGAFVTGRSLDELGGVVAPEFPTTAVDAADRVVVQQTFSGTMGFGIGPATVNGGDNVILIGAPL